MVLGGRVFGEVIRNRRGHEGEAPINGVSASVRVRRKLASSLLFAEVGSLQPGRGLSPELDHAGSPISDFQHPGS